MSYTSNFVIPIYVRIGVHMPLHYMRYMRAQGRHRSLTKELGMTNQELGMSPNEKVPVKLVIK